MAQGHILDANTAFLWRFNERRVGYPALIRDSGPHGYHVTATTNSRSARMRDYGPNGEMCRLFIGGALFSSPVVTTHSNAANNATILAALKTQLTFECFIRWVDVDGRAIMSFGGASSVVFRVDIQTNGLLGTMWEISGVDQVTTQTVGVGLVEGVWSHVAVVINATQILFYINGAHQETIAKPGAPNGATSEFHLGCNRNSNLGLYSYLKDFKITTRAKTAGEIATAAALLNTTFELPLEVDTLVLYRMDDNEELSFDEGVNEMTLYNETVAGPEPRPAHGLIRDSENGSLQFWDANWLFSHTYGDSFKGAAVQAFHTMLLSAFTFECWMRMGEPDIDAQHGIWCWGDPGLTTAIGNFLTVDVMSDGRIQWWSEYGVDADSIGYSAVGTITPGTHHLALRRNATVAGVHSVDVFIDGVMVDTISGIIPFASGAGSPQAFYLGYGASEGTNPFFGYLDDVRFSDIARTDAEIYESYRRGVTDTVYRMRGKLVSTGEYVYWSTSDIDPIGSTFPGGHALTDVVIVSISCE